MKLRLYFTALCAMLAFGGIHAQTPPPPAPYLPQTWDIDWSYLKTSSNRLDWTDRLHYIPLRDDSFLAITGQIRQRGEYQDHPAFGAQPPDNGYLQQRYLASGDLHLGKSFRTFVQLSSGVTVLRDGGPRPGIDQDKLDFNQGFLDLSPIHRADTSLTLRAGRQLVSLGSTRLVATGIGLNVQQPFDGFRLTLRRPNWTAEGLALRPTLTRAGVFDNQPNHAEELWGLYLTRSINAKVSLDLYYLGLDHRSAIYARGTGREQRETLGARLWSHTPTWDYDLEYTGQFGRFGNGSISAFGVGYHIGYTFNQRRFAPHPQLDGGVLSGDSSPHSTALGTFNPLFPNGNYLNEAILIGPYNLVIARPTFKLSLPHRVASNTNLELLWRQSLADGVYNIAGFITHPPAGSSARFIGAQIQQVFDFTFSRHVGGSLAFEHFFTGSFMRQSPPGHGLNFISPQLTYNF